MSNDTENTDEERELLREAVARMLDRHESDAFTSSANLWPDIVAQGLLELSCEPRSGGIQGVRVVNELFGAVGSGAPLLGNIITRYAARESDIIGDNPTVLSPGSCVQGRAANLCVNGNRISGTLYLVENCREASQIAILSTKPTAVVLVQFGATGVRQRHLPGLFANDMVDVALDDVECVVVPSTLPRIETAIAAYHIGLLGRALGAAQRVFDLAVEYARTREQFGQPIGRFQAIQHKLASMAILLDSSRLLIEGAADAYDRASPQLPHRLAAAAAVAGKFLPSVSLEAHHVFGAIGYAEEHVAPRLFRCLRTDLALGLSAREARNQLARLTLDESVQAEKRDEPNHVACFRQELRGWLAANWTSEMQAEHRRVPFEQRGWDEGFVARMGDAGLTTLTWDRSAGGQQRTPREQLAFLEEFIEADAPDRSNLIANWIVAPHIIEHGTAEMKAALLPGMRAGKISFCLGYSEPGSGSDLASLRTRAVRSGNWYVINGQKIWTSDGDRATHVILAARTNPSATPKRAGISLFLVPMNTPGIRVRPTMAMYGHTFCNVFYDDVRVHESMRLGHENDGWGVLTGALASERVVMGSFVVMLSKLLRRVVADVRDDPNRARDPVVRDVLGGLLAEAEAAHALSLRSIDMIGSDGDSMIAAAMSKVYSSELGERIGDTCIDLFGPPSLLGEGASGALAKGSIEYMLRRSVLMVIGGGTNEIQRNLIAQRGLNLPR